MKPFSINVQIAKCPKQYESVRLGMECTLDSGETAEQAIKEATAQLNAIYAEMISPAKPKPAPQPAPKQAPQTAQTDEEKPKAKPAAPQPVVAEPQQAQETPQPVKETPQPAAPEPQPIQREPLKFGDPRITKAVKRMENDPSKAADVYDNMLKYFDPDEQTLNVLKLAAKLI
jgi:hypothetical protein